MNRSSPHSGRRNGPFKVLFNPAVEDRDLYDTLAEQQAMAMPSGRDAINSSQLRRFFGEVKDLYRQYNALVAGKPDPAQRAEIYRRQIEPRFKLVRSKVAYANRPGGQGKIPDEFSRFLSDGIAKVRDHEQFVRFVTHFEAVVGFMYGNDRVSK